MPLFFKKRSDIEVAPYSDEERDAVMAALQLMFEENENLKYKDIGSIVCVVDSEGLEKKYTLRCRIFRNPQGQLVAVAPEILGAGAFGMVYLGQNLESAQFCVAKQQKQDISSEIDNFNGIYADEYKSQTFVVKPKLNVPLWIGFMPFFNGVDGDSVGYACSIPERQLGDLVFFEPHEEAANNKKRMQIIDDHTTEPAPKKKPVRSDSENTMVVTPLSEEEGELLGDFPEGNHPIITKTMEFIANNKHVDFDSLDFKAFFQDIFDGVGATTKNKTKAFGAFKRHFAKLVASAKISDHAWGDNVDSLPNNFKISTLAENLQSSVEVALSFVERVQTAHDQNYLLKDLKAENIIVAPNHKVYLIDSDAVIKMLPGVTTIQSTAMARSGTPQYFSPEATAEVKYNQLHY